MLLCRIPIAPQHGMQLCQAARSGSCSRPISCRQVRHGCHVVVRLKSMHKFKQAAAALHGARNFIVNTSTVLLKCLYQSQQASGPCSEGFQNMLCC